jgi:hypothetical protein
MVSVGGGIPVFVPSLSVRANEGIEALSLELDTDLRLLRRRARLILFAVLCELRDESESDELELEESLELDEFKMSAKTPGWDSSSIRCCGVLAYMKECDFNEKIKYKP